MGTQDLYEVWKQKCQEDGGEQGVKQPRLAVLEARGSPVDEEPRARIAGGTDAATLTRWLAPREKLSARGGKSTCCGSMPPPSNSF